MPNGLWIFTARCGTKYRVQRSQRYVKVRGNFLRVRKEQRTQAGTNRYYGWQGALRIPISAPFVQADLKEIAESLTVPEDSPHR